MASHWPVCSISLSGGNERNLVFTEVFVICVDASLSNGIIHHPRGMRQFIILFCGELKTFVSRTEVMLFEGRLSLGNILTLKSISAVMHCVLSFFIQANSGTKIPTFFDKTFVFCIDCMFFTQKTSEQGGNSAMQS